LRVCVLPRWPCAHALPVSVCPAVLTTSSAAAGARAGRRPDAVPQNEREHLQRAEQVRLCRPEAWHGRGIAVACHVHPCYMRMLATLQRGARGCVCGRSLRGWLGRRSVGDPAESVLQVFVDVTSQCKEMLHQYRSGEAGAGVDRDQSTDARLRWCGRVHRSKHAVHSETRYRPMDLRVDNQQPAVHARGPGPMYGQEGANDANAASDPDLLLMVRSACCRTLL